MAKKESKTEVTKVVASVEAKSDKPSIPTEVIETENGKKYQFVCAKFNIPSMGIMTAEEAMSNELAIAYLITENCSGILAEVKEEA